MIVGATTHIETTSRVVVTHNGSTSGQSFSDRDALAFTSRNTTNDRVTDFGVVSVLQTENSSEDISVDIGKLLSAFVRKTSTSSGSSSLYSKVESLGTACREMSKFSSSQAEHRDLHGDLGEVLIIFGQIGAHAAVSLFHSLMLVTVER